MLDRVLNLLAACDGPGKSGLVLAGPDGVGKTLVAHAAADRFAAARPSAVTRWVVGTATDRIVPFGAFGRLVNIGETGRPAQLLRTALDSLTSDGGEQIGRASCRERV